MGLRLLVPESGEAAGLSADAPECCGLPCGHPVVN